jgi:quercetin 2,3-dioxygenase
MGEVDYAPGEPRAPPGTRTGASRPSPTCSTGSSGTGNSNGGGGRITDGDTQWMTAGGGLSILRPLVDQARLPPAISVD